MKTTSGFVALLIFGASVASARAGTGVTYKLSQVADQSSLIVIAKVKELKLTHKSPGFGDDRWEATVEVISVLKGKTETKQLIFGYRTSHYKQGSRHEWKISKGDTMVFFIKEFRKKLYLTSIGTAAKFDDYFIEKEPSNETIDGDKKYDRSEHAEGDTKKMIAPPPSSSTTRPMGRLGLPIGTYVKIEGHPYKPTKPGKAHANILVVDTVQGKKLDSPVELHTKNVAIDSLQTEVRCVLKGYESGAWVGSPEGLAPGTPVQQTVFHFHHLFVVTSVEAPKEIEMKR